MQPEYPPYVQSAFTVSNVKDFYIMISQPFQMQSPPIHYLWRTMIPLIRFS